MNLAHAIIDRKLVNSSMWRIVAFAGLASFSQAAFAQPCGNPWTLHPGPGPSARSRHATTYDSTRGKVILFGGGSNADTWEWTAAGPQGGGSWALRAISGPPALRDAGLAYDSLRQKTVLFGGMNNSSQPTNQTWEWDGSAWTLAAPVTLPPAMSYILMAYDTSRQRVVMVSTVSSGPQSGATFEYDGQTWSQMPDLTPIPGFNQQYSLAYDAARARMVLSGYAYSPNAYGHATWEREFPGWVMRNIEILPVETAGLSTVYDPIRAKVVYVDSRVYSGGTAVWSFDGALNQWRLVSSGGPPLTSDRRPVFDVAGNQLVLFGGQPTNGVPSDQTWLSRSDIRSGPTLIDFGVRRVSVAYLGPPQVLSVTASGKGQLSYQWRLNGVAILDGTSFQGATTSHLTINPEDTALSGQYDALVTDSCGTSIRPSTQVIIWCYPNCDGVGGLGSEDWICFLTAYNLGTSYANCDGVGGLTANDFICFWNWFVRGCN